MRERRVLFIADQFADATRTSKERHPGGAELTDQTAIDACPWPIQTARAAELSPRELIDFDIHIIGNCETAAPEVVAELTRLGRHILFEHDLRICLHNGNYPAGIEQAHLRWHRCICPFPHLSALYRTARGVVFLTRRQLAHYLRNPFFQPNRTHVLGVSLLNAAFFKRVDAFCKQPIEKDIDTTIVYSPHPIKGYEIARQYCDDNHITPHLIRDCSPEEVLDVFERSKRFIYLPLGLEPAGRMLVEARFLGCEVISNDNAGVCGESWWRLPQELALAVARDAPARLWRIVDECATLDNAMSPTATRSMALTHGKFIAKQFNEHLATLQRWFLPKSAIKMAEKQLGARSTAACVVATPTRVAP